MLLYKKPYPISKDKLLVIKKYINKYFNKGFIYFSISLVATPIFLAKKLRGGNVFHHRAHYTTKCITSKNTKTPKFES